MDLSAGRQGLVLRVEMDVGTGVELECSYRAGDGRTRSGVASMPKERSGGPWLDRSCDWKSMDMTVGSIMGKLTQEEWDATEKQADEWNEEQLPAEVQAK